MSIVANHPIIPSDFSTQRGSSLAFSKLPPNVLTSIFSRLDLNSMKAGSLVNRHWRNSLAHVKRYQPWLISLIISTVNGFLNQFVQSFIDQIPEEKRELLKEIVISENDKRILDGKNLLRIESVLQDLKPMLLKYLMYLNENDLKHLLEGFSLGSKRRSLVGELLETFFKELFELVEISQKINKGSHNEPFVEALIQQDSKMDRLIQAAHAVPVFGDGFLHHLSLTLLKQDKRQKALKVAASINLMTIKETTYYSLSLIYVSKSQPEHALKVLQNITTNCNIREKNYAFYNLAKEFALRGDVRYTIKATKKIRTENSFAYKYFSKIIIPEIIEIIIDTRNKGAIHNITTRMFAVIQERFKRPQRRRLPLKEMFKIFVKQTKKSGIDRKIIQTQLQRISNEIGDRELLNRLYNKYVYGSRYD